MAEKLNLGGLQPLSPFTGPALGSGLEGGMFIMPQAKDYVRICCCCICVSPFCSGICFHPVDLHFLLYLSLPPSFIFSTYVVVERKYNMILGLAFQFHCIFMGQAESQFLELLG